MIFEKVIFFPTPLANPSTPCLKIARSVLGQTSRSENICFSLLRTESSKKLELFKVPVLLVITLARNSKLDFDPFFLQVDRLQQLYHI